ncbi:COG5508/DUF1674 domain-containing protein [Candidatus Trichorickettsia mobilis]|uniref:COG5508/DUF1674 domain-containing protein n=1 Tax=Candidatus Trichorickettsia mobilis TaxID=1346319 RepID=A0ABZ0UQA5_9RICK|nr:COG5508/DUF1674 domain-containing protein [Candidatus Trichorickettsia mobilis]
MNKDNDIAIDEILPKEKKPQEINGAKGQEPTTYGDWQHKGRVTDF